MIEPGADRVEVHDSAPAARREIADPDEPLLDRGTKVILVVFAFAVLLAIAAIAVSVIAF